MIVLQFVSRILPVILIFVETKAVPEGFLSEVGTGLHFHLGRRRNVQVI